jgi:ATP diphosphatase
VANNKFLTRYKAMERLARERGLSLDALDMAARNALWEEVKKA